MAPIIETLALNGINATTGEPLQQEATLEQIAALACGEQLAAGDLEELRRWRSHLEKDHLDTRFEIDPRNLAETGWGVIFPEDRQDEFREALAPLLALRKAQASGVSENRYRELVHRPGESKARFLARYRVGPGPADPDVLPYYLLIVGSPEEISFRFQYQLDVQYAVGRLSFVTAEEYSRYAASVVAAERGTLTAARRVSFFGVSNPDDRATASSLRNLVEPLAASISRDRAAWPVETVLGPDATKAALAERLGGARTPALLFTASHGVGFDPADPRHVAHQGALLCQDWPGPKGWWGQIPQDHYLAGDDVPDTASPAGLVAFFFACYGAGTPLYDSFESNGEQRRIAAESFVARLPQRLLSHPKGGALAVVGHVDRAWSYSFDWPESGKQLQVFESALGRLLEGYPVGAATEYFNQRYAELSTDLAEEREEARWGAKPDFLNLSQLWTAAHDARSYVVLGDPAVRLAPGPAVED
ncbi:MAG TPA: C25 family cysteine peptidase [Thermoanaerobaculia bacterium]|nr:C25 family cysteine peptidase [Thermoanaerobaculia bacterium]